MVFRAMPSENMGALRFLRERLKPVLANEFSGLGTVICADPAGQQRAQTDERSVYDIIKAERLTVKPARTNAIAARVAAVDSFLTRTIDGEPGVVLCPEGCEPLIRALQSKYRYKVKTTGEVEDKPEKTHPWSDLADAFQYLCLFADAGATFAATVPERREIKKVRYAYT